MGTVYPTFRDEKVQNLLSPANDAVDRRLHSRMRRGVRLYFLLVFLPSSLETKRRLVLLLNWYPHFLDQSYAPTRLEWIGLEGAAEKQRVQETPKVIKV